MKQTSRTIKHKNLLALCEGAVTLAMATLLGYLKLLELPQGGSVCLGMLPIFLYCRRWGWKKGFLTSFGCGLLQLLLDGAYAWGPACMLLDFLLAYGVLGVAGFFRRGRAGIFIGAAVASCCRFAMHFLSGATLYRIYAPTEVFHITFTNPYLYSAVYNSYVLIDLVLCLVVIALLERPLDRFLTGKGLEE